MAIAVLVAAAAGEFVFGLDVVTFKQPTVGPQATFVATEHDGGELTIKHAGGDALDVDEITVDPDEGSVEGGSTLGGVLGDEWTPVRRSR